MSTDIEARAAAAFRQGLLLNPSSAAAHIDHGHAQLMLHGCEDALASYDSAIALSPGNAEAHRGRANALFDLCRYQAALASYDAALAIAPGPSELYNDRGIALCRLGRYPEAVASYDAAVSLQPGNADACSNRGNALRELRLPEAALASYDQAILIDPRRAEFHNNRGNALCDLRRFEAALASYERAIALDPHHAELHHNRGNALRELGRLQDALDSYRRVLALDPHHAQAYCNRGNALRELGDHEAALASYEQAWSLKADLKFLPGMRWWLRMQLCEWADYDLELGKLTAGVERGEPVSAPLVLLAASDSARLQQRAAEIWVREECPPNSALGPIATRARDGRIRIGYFSADFHAHATMHLLAEVFELHDRSRFEVIAFSFGPDSADAARVRLLAGCEQFIEVRHLTDLAAARLARDRQIDIAVDLKGFTQHNRAGIFAARAAPLQVGYLGYAGTMTAEYMDYLIADEVLVPADARRFYGEKLLYLPDSYQANDSRRPIAGRAFTREECGLPPTGFVFCCFNNSFKITPGMFGLWMRLLRRIEGSVLWLLRPCARTAANLQREAIRRGVDPARLIFADFIAPPEHLARHRLADLFLDTLPYNAHTTASDALWAGLPLLTCTGRTFAGRVGASLLRAAGLAELITATPQEYEALALELAMDAGRLAGIRQHLHQNLQRCALFDARRFTAQLERAYSTIHARYQEGLPADHLHHASGD